jgi:hypothetical protein
MFDFIFTTQFAEFIDGSVFGGGLVSLAWYLRVTRTNKGGLRPSRQWRNYVLVGVIAFFAGVVFDVTRSGAPLSVLWLALASAISGGIFAVVLAGMVRVPLDTFRLNREQARIRRENSELRAEIARLRRALGQSDAK